MWKRTDRKYTLTGKELFWSVFPRKRQRRKAGLWISQPLTGEQGEALDSESLPTAKMQSQEYDPDLENIPEVTGLNVTSVTVGESLTTEHTEIFRKPGGADPSAGPVQPLAGAGGDHRRTGDDPSLFREYSYPSGNRRLSGGENHKAFRHPAAAGRDVGRTPSGGCGRAKRRCGIFQGYPGK